MNEVRRPYESEYVRKDVMKVRTRQQRGEILVATRKDAWPLPYIHDVPGLRREGSGYSSPWGRFQTLYDPYELCVFQPVEGGKYPPVWTEHDLNSPIEPASALIDLTRRCARIVTDDGKDIATLSDVSAWENGWQLLDQFRQILAQNRVPAVVWRAELQASGERPLWDGPAPLVRNDHAAVNLAGYAYDDDGNLVYLSAVGHKTALEAIRASLLGRHHKGKLQLNVRNGYRSLNGLDRYEQVWAPLPDFAAHHVVFLARQGLESEPTDDVTYLLAYNLDGDEAPDAQAKQLLVERLHQALPIPILDEWAKPLWDTAEARGWITVFHAGGDCRACWRVSLQAGWAELIEELIAQGEIEITI